MSSSRREPADLAALYSRKANNDATAAREFADNSEISDEIIGFHARQQRTDDIDQLSRVLEKHGVDLPAPRSRLAELTDFAVPLRYEDLLDTEPLDRRATVALVDEVGKWARDQIALSGESDRFSS